MYKLAITFIERGSVFEGGEFSRVYILSRNVKGGILTIVLCKYLIIAGRGDEEAYSSLQISGGKNA